MRSRGQKIKYGKNEFGPNTSFTYIEYFLAQSAETFNTSVHRLNCKLKCYFYASSNTSVSINSQFSSTKMCTN